MCQGVGRTRVGVGGKETGLGLRQRLAAVAVELNEVAIIQASLVIARHILETQCYLLLLILFPIALGMEIRTAARIAL